MRAIVATTGDPRAIAACDAIASRELPPGDITSPYYWSDYSLDKYEAERQLGELEAGPPPLAPPRTVLLITGVTITAEWFDSIVARLERDGFRFVVYEPPDLLNGDLFTASDDEAVPPGDASAEDAGGCSAGGGGRGELIVALGAVGALWSRRRRARA